MVKVVGGGDHVGGGDNPPGGMELDREATREDKTAIGTPGGMNI